MVRCPKCGIKGWENYYPIVTIDTDFDDDEMVQINKVKCTECEHEYLVREYFTLTFEHSYNID